MSRLKTDAIRNVNASVDGITLDTSGNVAIPNELQLAEKIVHTGDTNTFIRFPAADVIAFETGGTERLRINSDGRIWVNTQTGSSATELLRVENTGSASTDSRISIVSGGTGKAVLLFGDDQSFDQGQIVYSNSDHSMRFHANAGNERLRITSDGKVGIGTTSPDAPLTVHSSSDPEIRFGYSSSQDHRLAWDSSKVFLHADPENANSNSALGLSVDGSTRLYITEVGKVGIGDSSPDCRLHVNSGAADDALKIESTDASVNLILRDSVCTSLIQQNNTTLMIGSDSANTTAGSIIAFYVDGTEQARIANGISFNGDTATQNMLNDYEEGVHIVTDAHTNWIWGSGTNAYRTVAYTKIGRQVTLTGQIVCRANGEANGTLISISLPFVCLNDVSNQDQGQSGGACRLYAWTISNPDDCIGIMVGTYDGLSYAHIHASYSGAVSQTVGGHDGAYIQFSLTYMTN